MTSVCRRARCLSLLYRTIIKHPLRHGSRWAKTWTSHGRRVASFQNHTTFVFALPTTNPLFHDHDFREGVPMSWLGSQRKGNATALPATPPPASGGAVDGGRSRRRCRPRGSASGRGRTPRRRSRWWAAGRAPSRKYVMFLLVLESHGRPRLVRMRMTRAASSRTAGRPGSQTAGRPGSRAAEATEGVRASRQAAGLPRGQLGSPAAQHLRRARAGRTPPPSRLER